MTEDRRTKAQLVKEVKALRRKLRRLERLSDGGSNETHLPRQDDYFEALVRNSPVAMVAVDLSANVVAWNPAAEQLFGYTFGEAVGKNLDDLVARSEALRAEALGYSVEARQGGRIDATTRRTRKDGSLVDVDVLGLPVILRGEQQGFIAIYHDIRDRKRAEVEQRRQKEYFEAILNNSPVAIVTMDDKGHVVSWNPAAESLFGYSSPEAIGQNVDDLVASSDLVRSEAQGYSRLNLSGEAVRVVTRRSRKDGSLVDVELQGLPVMIGDAQKGYIAIYHDITAHKQAQAELNEQKTYLEAVVEHSPAAIVVINPDATVRAWNPGAEKLFGYTPEEAIGQNIDDLVATSAEVRAEAVGFSRKGGRGAVIHAITRRTRKDGSLVDVELSAVPVDFGGKQRGYIALYHDVSAHKQAEAELSTQKSYLEAVVQHSPVAIVVIDRDTIVRAWNPGAEKLFGYSPDEAIGHDIDDLVAKAPEIRTEAVGFSRGKARGAVIHAITRRTRKDGSLVDVELSAVPNVDFGGEQKRHIALYHDITAHKQAEAELRQEKQRFEAVIQHVPVAIVMIGFDGNVRAWNPGAERLFGYTAEEAVGRNIDDLVASSPEIHAEAVGFTEKGAGGEVIHAITRRMRKDGTLVDVELHAVPVVVGDEPGLLGIAHDISEVKRAEEELRRQKQYFEAVVSHSPVAIAVIGVDGRVSVWNPGAEKLFGYSVEEAYGRDIDDLVAKAPEIHAEAVGFTQQKAKGGVFHAITRRTRRDGSLVDVELLGVPIYIGDERVGTIAIYHDITELQRARQEAESANQAKSAFLATMSHEIRTPMNAIIGMSGLLLDTELADEQREFAEIIRDSGDALLTIINDILDFSKIEAGRMELEQAPFDLRECVEATLDLVAAQAAKKHIDLAYEIEDGTPQAVVGDLPRTRQVLLNLLNNGVKFTEQGEVVLTVSARRLSRGQHEFLFTVRDTGIGIPADRVGRLFQSFTQADASTTRKYGGTGLGLAISKRLTELMGGRMWVESDGLPGQGSSFHFTFVGKEASPLVIRPERLGQQPSLRGRRVLIVDDHQTNRTILVHQTQAWGMLARDTGSAGQALAWIRAGEPFDLAILDHRMSEMDGLTLAGEIHGLRPEVPMPMVILSSLGKRDTANDYPEIAAYVTKPVKPSLLFDALVTVFAEAQPSLAEEAMPPRPQAGPAMASRRPLRILVAEDNAVNQKLALRLLAQLGYRADVAADGVEVIEALERQTYDVVLMDVQMPEVDGLEATRRIVRRWPASARPRIIAMTANAMQGDRELCLEAGMDDYISKPIRVEELVAALSRTPAGA